MFGPEFRKDHNGNAFVRVNPQDVFPMPNETAEGYLFRMTQLQNFIHGSLSNPLARPEPEMITKDVMDSILAAKAMDTTAQEDETQLAEAIAKMLEEVEQMENDKKQPGEKPAPEKHQSFILEGAKDIVYGPRQHLYGHAAVNFKRIAGMWESVFGAPVSPLQVGIAMMMLKVARAVNLAEREWQHGVKPKFSEIEDSMKDIAGYAEVVMRAMYEQPDGSRTTE